jgi:folate-binding protein YgfZ
MKQRVETTELVLHDLHAAFGAEFTPFAGHLIPAHYGDPATELEALASGAGLVDLSYRAVFRLSGRDPVGMLQAVTTNEIPPEDGRGTYAALLSPKGRLLTDLRILKTAGEVFVATDPEGRAAAQEVLGRYAPFSRVELRDLTGEWGVLGAYGPEARQLLRLGLAEHAGAEVEVGGAALLAVGVERPVPGFDLLGPVEGLRAAWESLVAGGARPVGLHAFETARVAAGVPRFGADMTEDNFPAEADILERAVSFEKGCYPGQETVARMHYRGRPNRTLRRFRVAGEAAAGAEILQEGKPVGRLTSVAPLPVNGDTFALGYLHRKADPAAPLRAGKAALSPDAP